MLVAQISDLHVAEGRGLAFNVADGALLLEKTVAHLATLPQQPLHSKKSTNQRLYQLVRHQ